jgi:hypothetical protein
MSLGIVGIVLASVATLLVPTTGWAFPTVLLAGLAVSAIVVLMLLAFVHLAKGPGPR